MNKILLAGQDSIWRQGLRQTLNEKGYQTISVDSLAEAMRQSRHEDLQYVLLDAGLLAGPETEAELGIGSSHGTRLLLLARSYADLQRAQEAQKKWGGADSRIVLGPFTARVLFSAMG